MMTKDEFAKYYDGLSVKEKSDLDNMIEADVAKSIWIPLVNDRDPTVKTPQQKAVDSKADILLYGGAAFGGKLARLGSLVATPFGFRKMGDLKVGDRVCNPDGGNSQIIGVYPQGQQQLYRLTFVDGSTTEAGGEHLWKYKVQRKGKWRKSGARWKIGTTLQIMDMMEGGRNIAIPLTKPVQFTKSYRYDYRKIHPYVLGVLLGDGSITGGQSPISITSADPELMERICRLTRHDWHLVNSNNDKPNIHYTCKGDFKKDLCHWLGKLELLGKRSWEKHIPQQYLHGDIPSRFELAKGLFDTDGYASADGKAYYTTTSEQLARDVQWLVWSLGGKASISNKIPTYTHNGEKGEGRRAYTVYARLPDNADLFYLERKRLRANAKDKNSSRRIISIEKTDIDETQCIKVDHINGLYIADDFIVTHNTNMLCGLALTQHQRSTIFRRKKEDVMPIAEELIKIRGTKKGYNSQLKRLNTEDGRNIRLAGMQYEQDKQSFKGDARDLHCVAKGTPVLMGDNSHRPIEELVVGDMVQTLEGPRRVNRVFPTQIKEAIKLSAYNGNGEFICSQVQGLDHEVLTSSGWVSHDKIYEFPSAQRRSSGSSGYCSDGTPLSSSSQKFLSNEPRPPENSHTSQKNEPSQLLAGLRSRMDSGVSCRLSNQGNDFLMFGDERQVFQKPEELFSRLKLPEPSEELAVPSLQPCASLSDNSDVPYSSSPEDCLESYSRDSHLYDEQPHTQSVTLSGEQVAGQLYLHRQGDAGEPNRGYSGLGDSEGIPKYNRPRLLYDHPYKKDTRRILPSVALEPCSYRFSYVGIRELYDIEVDEVNHYISSGGIISSNCFDEIVDFTETQFRFVITWNRSPDPNQRCRVICSTNPPTTYEGEWIIGFWGPWLDPDYPNPALPGELRWFVSDEEGKDKEVPNGDPIMINGELHYPKSRTFIPSSIDDNPFASIAYRATLQSLPEPLRSQMLTGDFLAGREDDPWQVIPTEWVEAAMDRWPEQKPPHLKMDAIGVDTARGGKDLFVIAPRYDWWFDELIVVNGEDVPDGPKGAALCTQHVRDGASINVDVIGGSGTSVYDHLRTNGANVQPVDGRAESHARDKTGSMGFFNKRAENMWRLREALDPESDENIALPLDRQLKRDLTAPRWKLTSRGIQVEGKYSQAKDGFGAIIDRIGVSTDRGDALINAYIEGKRASKKFKRGPSKANSSYSVNKRWRKK